MDRHRIPKALKEDLPWPPAGLMLGRNKSGKTSLARAMMQVYARQNRRILALVTSPKHLPEIGPLVTPGFLARERRWPRRFRMHVRASLLNDVVRLAAECQDYLLFVDDVDRYLKTGLTHDGLYTIASTGRHQGIGYLFATRRPHALDPDFREAANEYYVFRTRNGVTLRWLADDLDIPAGCVTSLGRFFYVHHNRDDGRTVVLGGPSYGQ